MKKMYLWMVLSTSYAVACGPKKEDIVVQNREHDEIDDLLHDAHQDGVDKEEIKPRELPRYQLWIRSIGGALFMKCVVAKNYIKKLFN